MEIKVGELVRTHKGIIGTLQSQELTYPEPSEWILDVNGKEVIIVECDDYITKHSFNLIDLIEVGDILELKEGNSICYLGLRKNQITVNYPDLIESIKNKDCELLSILTHEQYEQNCYKIEN